MTVNVVLITHCLYLKKDTFRLSRSSHEIATSDCIFVKFSVGESASASLPAPALSLLILLGVKFDSLLYKNFEMYVGVGDGGAVEVGDVDGVS